MRRPRASRLLGVAFVGMVLLLMGAHHPLRPVESTQEPDDFDSVVPNLTHVLAPPRSIAETKTWLKLQEIVPMNFPNDTSLKDFIQSIRESTKDGNAGFPKGIPIYVDPQGLQDADKTMESTITIELDGMPLGKSLRLAFKQLGLIVKLDKDGLVVITSTGCDTGEPVPDDFASWQSLDTLRLEIQALRQEVRALRREKFERPAQPPATGLPVGPAPLGGMGGGFR